MDNDDFFRCDTIFARNDEEIDAFVNRFHCVMEAAGRRAVMGLEMVDHCASHIVNLDVGFPFDSVKEELHVSVVGIGDDIELRLCVVFIKIVEGAEEPVTAFNTFGIAFVVDGGVHPNRVWQ